MFDNLPSVMLFLLQECVVVEESKPGHLKPVWVPVQQWHDLITSRLNVQLPLVKQVGGLLITNHKIQLHSSGRFVRPAGSLCK